MNVSYIKPEQLRERLRSPPFRSPLIILSESGAKRWGLYSLIKDLQKDGKILWFSNPDTNPTQNTLQQALKKLHGFSADGIIAVGGGSVIDIAKAISAFNLMPDLESSEFVSTAIVSKAYLNNHHRALPVIAVPTTAGTGSEVTQWATIWDSGGSAKYSVDAPWLKPSQAWIVPQLLTSLPTKVMLATGLDAVCHATEAYWAKASNPLSKVLSIRALEIMTSNLKPGLENPRDEEVLKNLCTGSLLSGLAFSTTRTTACHSISYPLTYMFGMEHGFAAAVTLAQVADINNEACGILEVLEVFSRYGGIQAWIDSTCEGVLPLRLKAFGIEMKDIDVIAANCFTAGRMDNNPVDLSVELVKKMLYDVY